MSAVRVLGDADTVLAFALGGVPGDVVDTAADARAALAAAIESVRRGGGLARSPMLLLVTDAVVAVVREDIERLALTPAAPLILQIPGFGAAPAESGLERFVTRILEIHQ